MELSSRLLRPVFGLVANGEVQFSSQEGFVRLILVDRNYEEHLLYETYPLIEEGEQVLLEDLGEETVIMPGIRAGYLRVEIKDATLNLNSLTWTAAAEPSLDAVRGKKERLAAQNQSKVERLNRGLGRSGQLWLAGQTEVSELTWAEKRKLFGESSFPPGFEYYIGGIYSTGERLKAAAASLMVEKWDWRSRHGKSWITSVKNQGGCGSCWAFAVTGATEALVNLFYNQQLNLDLSEQDVLSCSGAGSCSGGYPSTSLTYITNTGIVDEAAFPYKASDVPCSNKSTTPAQLIKIGGRIDFGTTEFPRTEDGLKQGIIKYGPISGGIYDWSHAMALVGWQVVKEGDRFYTRDLNKSTYWITVPAGSPLIGTTVWIFKNSWGGTWGDAGYVYVQTSMSNVGWTHALKTPVQSLVKSYSVQCVDNDGDGYYWWGLGPKPANCPTCPDQPDGDDSNANLGPLDQYGNCVVLGVPPIADFQANKLVIDQYQSVTFTDLSTNAPSSWSWQFPGGTPSTSSQQNPVVTYNTPGVYSVSLTVTNSGGSDTETKSNYITVVEYIPTYCSSKGYALEEWIAGVQVNTQAKTSGSSGSAGYQDFLAQTFTLNSGQSHTLTLTPGFTGRAKFEYWSVWIDLNGDKDFDDAGELLFTASKKNTAVTGTITIPAMGAIETRMRVAMKRGSLAGPCETFSSGEVEDYTVVISGPVAPVANFTASPNPVQEGGTVQFNDLSTGSPTSWSWAFPGGSPSTSTQQNPAVVYAAQGTYTATLTVSNALGSSSRSVSIEVTEVIPVDYCVPVNISSADGCINTVSIGIFTASGSCNGYSLTQSGPALAPGKSYTVTLTPSNSTARYFWRIWIDFNGDGDFIDSGEQLVAINNKKGVGTATMVIPAQASGTTRMRVTARINASPAPCDDSFAGEVADYVVTFGAGSPGKKIGIQDDSNPVTGTLAVYPNPTRDLLNIRIDNWSAPSRLVVYNLNGQAILSRTLDSSIAVVDAGSWPKGMYLILVYTQDKLLKERVVVE